MKICIGVASLTPVHGVLLLDLVSIFLVMVVVNCTMERPDVDDHNYFLAFPSHKYVSILFFDILLFNHRFSGPLC